MNLIEIISESQFNFEIQNENKTSLNSLIVVSFYAKWCELCKTISPFVRKLSVAFSNVKFLNVDVEKFPAIAKAYNVIAMPTFVFIKNQDKVDELKGANASSLESKVKNNSIPISLKKEKFVLKNGISVKRNISNIAYNKKFSKSELKLKKNKPINSTKNDFSSIKRKDRKHIPNEVRRKLIECLDKKMCSRKEAAEVFNIPYATVANIYKKYCTLNIIEAKVRTQFKAKKLNDKHIVEIKNWLKNNCSISLKEIQSKLKEEFNITISENTINKVISNFHFSIKRISDSLNLDVFNNSSDERKQFCTWILSAIENKKQIVFIDESVFQISMRSFHKQSQFTTNLKPNNSNLQIRNKTISVAISSSGLVHYRIFEESDNYQYLKEFLDEIMLLVFDAGLENVVFIFNNLSEENTVDIENIIKCNGHELIILPSFGFDFNPAENLFSKWESTIRNNVFEDEEQLWNYFTNIRDIVTSNECSNFFLMCVDKCRIEIPI